MILEDFLFLKYIQTTFMHLQEFTDKVCFMMIKNRWLHNKWFCVVSFLFHLYYVCIKNFSHFIVCIFWYFATEPNLRQKILWNRNCLQYKPLTSIICIWKLTNSDITTVYPLHYKDNILYRWYINQITYVLFRFKKSMSNSMIAIVNGSSLLVAYLYLYVYNL